MTENIGWDTINILGTAITAFNYFIFIPLILYGLYTFHRHKDNDLMIYRNPLSVTLMNITVLFGLMIERMCVLLFNIFGIANVPAWSLHFLFALSWDLLIYLKIANIYYVYFRQQYNLAIADMAWKPNINSEVSASTSWYIDHKDTLGDMKYLMKMTIFPYIFMEFIDAIFSSKLDTWQTEIFHSMEILIPVLFGFVIVFKLRLLNDIYRIRNEVSIAMSILGLGFTIYMVVFSVRYVDESKSQLSDSVRWNRTSSLVTMFIMDLVAVPCSILSTMYPVYLIKKRKMDKHNHEQLMKYTQNKVCSDLQTMDKILSEYASYAAFMSYLVSEFCPENLLFLTELIECKIAYQKRKNNLVQILVEKEDECETIVLVNFNKNPMNLDADFPSKEAKNFTYIFHASGSIMTKLSLSPKVPTAIMIQKYPDSLYRQMATLYDKYINESSQLQLNISGSARIKLSKIFDNEHREIHLINGRPALIPIPLHDIYTGDMIYNIMDEVVIEILQLLQYSFSRFVSTEAFQRVNGDHKFERKNNCALFVDDGGNVGTVECPSQITDKAFVKRLNDPESGILINIRRKL